ncbi:MAG: DUF3369 domain-containing protein [Hyphomicrobiales bacterium]
MTAELAYPSFLKSNATEIDRSAGSAECAVAASSVETEPLWCVIVADDEPDVHKVTELALSSFTFEGRSLRRVHAYTGVEAVAAVRDNPDAAVLLLDVVMESEYAGLDAVRRIRDEIGNRKVRIVLRTGQPGAAPETDVVARYDINGYADKTELTRRKLETILHSSLRAFRDIQTIETQMHIIDTNRRGLEQVIHASAEIFRHSGFKLFAAGVLEQLSALIGVKEDRGSDSERPELPAVAAVGSDGHLTVVAGTGAFETLVDRSLRDSLPEDAVDRIMRCVAEQQSYAGEKEYIGVFSGHHGTDRVAYVAGHSSYGIDPRIVELFNRNARIAFDNIDLREMIETTQREIVYRLGGAVESRSKETANHVKRVAELSELLGKRWGLSEREAQILFLASPMHDLGKIGIPDEILNKPGKLTAQEWEVMKTHTTIGYDLLRDSQMEILQIGAMIALEHHEKWDGSGYPHGKRGTQIGLYGRITAIVDVFDALSNKRCYKDAWPLDDVLKHIRDNSGLHFDPRLVALFFDHLGEIKTIADRHPN